MQRPVVVTGSIAIDRIMNFSGSYAEYLHADKLDAVSVSIFLDGLRDSPGGTAANIAYGLALLGDEPYLLGSVGTDAIEYMESLAKHGVNITHIHESDLPTASFNVITDLNQNQVGGFYPGAMFDSETLSVLPWKEENPIVVIAPHDPKTMKRQVEECKQHKLTLCYDIGQQVSNTAPEDLRLGVEAAEILILNEYELSVLAEKIGRTVEALAASVPVLITTFGPNGSKISGKSVPAEIQIGVAQAAAAVDPTGAGDAYRSGFLYGYCRGWDIQQCAQLGATCASFAVEQSGTQAYAPTKQVILERYNNAFHETITLE